MTKGTHNREISVQKKDVWDFVSSMNNWAPLVPGYIQHDVLNEKESTWEFKTDLGLLKKKIKLMVRITSWEEPDKVTFDLIGMNENFSGSGFFLSEYHTDQTTKMTGCIEIEAKGPKGPLANSLLKSYVPKLAAELTEAVAARMEELLKDRQEELCEKPDGVK
ncbi:CoxG family protein [Bacillus massiliglaciei]|uniref:CoxG family protein n=1 Tax=Bacillus massiliglaciei TaxID=1816693 RepID=UPI000DA60D85|nr:SRPBCC family protein [Bacillus massiliglaciei]